MQLKLECFIHQKLISFSNKTLKKIKNKKIILDPVMIAKGGKKLINEKAIKTLKKIYTKSLILITPNIPEAEVLQEQR